MPYPRIKILASVAAAVILVGCTETPKNMGAAVDNDQNVMTGGPITGTTIDDLPQAVKDALKLRVPHAEIASIARSRYDRHAVYEFSFLDADSYPPLYLQDDGKVLPETVMEKK